MRCEEMDEVRIFGVGVPFGQWGPYNVMPMRAGAGDSSDLGFFRVGLPPLIIL